MEKSRVSPKLTTATEALSLNYIMLISPDQFTNYSVEVQQWEGICNSIKRLFMYKGVPTEERLMIRDRVEEFSSMCATSFSTTQDKINEWKVDRSYKSKEYPNLIKAINMCHNVFQHMSYRWNTKKLSENTFINQIVDPIIYSFLDNEDQRLVYKGSDAELDESKERKLKQALASNQSTAHVKGRIPDNSAYVESLNNNKHHVFLCEVKTEQCSTGRPDLVKLGLMMKDCIDYAIQKGVPYTKFYVVGLLVEGRTATLFGGSLRSGGIYALVALDTFHIPTDINDINVLVSASRGMLKCRELVFNAANIVASEVREEEVNLDWVRESCVSPPHHSEYYM